MSKRKLTKDDIDFILDFLDVSFFKMIPEEIRTSRIERIKNILSEQLIHLEFYPEIISELKREIKRIFIKVLLQPGEMVGILAATYIAEIVTQLTLNSFHFSGLSAFSISSGVPRLNELMNATKNISQPSMTLSLETKDTTISNLYQICQSCIEESTLSDLLNNKNSIDIQYNRILTPIEDKWYNIFSTLYSSNNNYSWSVRLIFDKYKLFSRKISLSTIASKIEAFRDLHCVFSPDQISIIDVYIETDDIEIPKNSDWLKEDNVIFYYISNTIISNLMNINVSGIDYVKKCHYILTNNTWKIETEGSNLVKTFSVPGVDYKNTISNDVCEIFQLLGIEAARAVLLNEYRKIISFGGFICKCNLEILCDAMSYSGKLMSVSRYGVDSTQTGPLARASFEETFDILLRVGESAEVEDLSGVSGCVIMGKLGKLGTGYFDLLLEPPEIEKVTVEQYLKNLPSITLDKKTKDKIIPPIQTKLKLDFFDDITSPELSPKSISSPGTDNLEIVLS